MNKDLLTPLEKAIDLVAQEEYKFNHPTIKEMSYRVGLNKGAQEVLNNPEKYELKRIEEWISVDDRLPPSMKYLICYDGEEVHSRLFSRQWEKLSIIEFKQKSSVTHWQPLPQPPLKRIEE